MQTLEKKRTGCEHQNYILLYSTVGKQERAQQDEKLLKQNLYQIKITVNIKDDK